MSDRPESDPRAIIGGQYLVDVTNRLPDAGGGVPAFAAINRRGSPVPAMALRVDRYAPARPRSLTALSVGIEGLLTPLEHGIGPPIDGQPVYYVICQAPHGTPLSSELRPWPEPALIEFVMRPIALVLEQLQSRGLTHRGIRLNNVFHGHPGRPVTLGAAWAAPPAMHQPAVYETPHVALCHPAARGEGRIADDVYALGVLLAALALGRVPMDGIDHRAILHRKFEVGDFNAVTGGDRLPPIMADIVRGMLAEDPEHRPNPAMLRDTVGARGRRVAARPPTRAQRPFKIGAMTVWNTKTLALAMALDPVEAIDVILNGTLMYWLRRGLSDSGLAVKLEELVREQAVDVATDKETSHSLLVMRAIADTDVFMPLCWRGLAIFPDGIGPALAAAWSSTGGPPVASAAMGQTETDPIGMGQTGMGQEREPNLRRRLLEIVLTEAQGIWSAVRDGNGPTTPQRVEARQRRAIVQIRGPAGGMPRLTYTLNPMMPCVSALLNSRWIANVRDLAPALDAIAAASPKAELLEPHIAAFIGARSERWLDREVKALSIEGDPADRTVTTLRLLTELQNRYHPEPLKGLTSWIASRAQPLVEYWKNREQRAAVEEQLNTLAALGLLEPILTLLANDAAHAADSEGMHAAIADLARLDSELHGIAEGEQRRAAVAARMGQEIAAGLGLAAIAATLILAAMG